jgi:hypothetical protein
MGLARVVVSRDALMRQMRMCGASQDWLWQCRPEAVRAAVGASGRCASQALAVIRR